MTTREEWLAGAEQRRAEPLREDRPEDVRARLSAVVTAVQPLDLAAIQHALAAWSTRTGRARDPLRQMLMLAEETGEVATEIRALEGFSRHGPGDAGRLAAELADVVIVACTLANLHRVDLAAAVAAKLPEVDARYPSEAGVTNRPA